MEKCEGQAVSRKGNLFAADCDYHGYVHLMPLPLQESMDRLYRSEYYELHNQSWFQKELREQWYWRKVYRQRLRFYQSLTGSWFRGQRDILDDGAGCGWFYEAFDIDASLPRSLYLLWMHEPSDAARLWGAKHIGMFINKERPQRIGFHFIHSSLVMEHVLKPRKYLADLFYTMESGGILCVVVPNEFNLLQRQLAERYGYSPLHPHHVNYFDQASIVRLVEKAGFEVVRVTSTFPMEWFALHGLNYVKHPKLGMFAHWLRMAIEWAALTVAPERWERARDGWAAKGWGRETEIWARKL